MNSNGTTSLYRLLTLPRAGREAGLGLRQIRRAVTGGELPVYQIGGWPRVRWGDVLDWIDRQRVPIRDSDKAQVHGELRVIPMADGDGDGTDPSDKGAA